MKAEIEVKAKTKMMTNAKLPRPRLSYQDQDRGEKFEAELPNAEL